MTTLRLSCQGISAGYGRLMVLRDFNLEAEAGSVIEVLGPNGAGKTTSMLAIAGLLPRIDGEVIVDGQSLPNGRAALANRAGVILVPDDRSLFNTLTVKENIAAASMGLAPKTVEDLLPVVRGIADRTGAVIVLVEQHIQLALEVADQVVVLVHGDVALSGPTKDLASDPSKLEAAYMGEAPTAAG